MLCHMQALVIERQSVDSTAETYDICWVQWHCLHDGDEAGGAFAFRMLQPDSEQRVSWDSLSAATAACMILNTGQEAPLECVAGIVQG